MLRTRTYYLDGTNLVRGCFGYAGPEFHAQEDADTQRLVAAVAELCERLGGRIEVEVFFDGAFRDVIEEEALPDNLRLRFTHETQADELILDSVRAGGYSGGGVITVVTGDGELGRLSEEEGGRWLRVKHGAHLESVLAAIGGRLSR